MNTREPLGHIEGSDIASLTWDELGLSSPATAWFPARHEYNTNGACYEDCPACEILDAEEFDTEPFDDTTYYSADWDDDWNESGTLEDDESFQTTLSAAVARIQVQAHYTGHAATPAPDTCGICAQEEFTFSTRS